MASPCKARYLPFIRHRFRSSVHPAKPSTIIMGISHQEAEQILCEWTPGGVRQNCGWKILDSREAILSRSDSQLVSVFFSIFSSSRLSLEFVDYGFRRVSQ